MLGLLVLALSPITTPFASCDLIGLLGGSGASAGAVLQAKPAPDDPTIAADRGPELQGPPEIAPRLLDWRTTPLFRQGPRSTQLRI